MIYRRVAVMSTSICPTWTIMWTSIYSSYNIPVMKMTMQTYMGLQVIRVGAVYFLLTLIVLSDEWRKFGGREWISKPLALFMLAVPIGYVDGHCSSLLILIRCQWKLTFLDHHLSLSWCLLGMNARGITKILIPMLAHLNDCQSI